MTCRTFFWQQAFSSKVSPKTFLNVWASLLSPVFALLPPQPGCVTTNSCAAKMAVCVSTTSAAAVPQPIQACSVRSLAASRSWGDAWSQIRARPPWHLHPPSGCCCCCCFWAQHCWESSKETCDLVAVVHSPPPPPKPSHSPLWNNLQPLNKNNHELSGLFWASLPPDSMDTRADKKRMCQTNECKDFSFNFKEYIEMEKNTSKNARYY